MICLSAHGILAVLETDLSVLVGSDCSEGSLREGEGLENTPAHTEQVVCLDNVEARMVAMHGVQNDLQTRNIFLNIFRFLERGFTVCF